MKKLLALLLVLTLVVMVAGPLITNANGPTRFAGEHDHSDPGPGGGDADSNSDDDPLVADGEHDPPDPGPGGGDCDSVGDFSVDG